MRRGTDGTQVAVWRYSARYQCLFRFPDVVQVAEKELWRDVGLWRFQGSASKMGDCNRLALFDHLVHIRINIEGFSLAGPYTLCRIQLTS